MSIPVTVLVMTKNEATQIGRCLTALRDFDEVIVVDSSSADATTDIARTFGAQVIQFSWNGLYPKKRQWTLDNVPRRHDWIFFVDADEEVTAELTAEITTLMANGPDCAGYFIRGDYVLNGKRLRHGLANNKLALFNARKIHFPAVDDLDLPGMGEIEGHYQPVLINPPLKGEGRVGSYNGGSSISNHRNTLRNPSLLGRGLVGQLNAPLLHHANDDPQAWESRHRRYAAWEAGMNAENAWPRDPDPKRENLKCLFRAMPSRGVVAFLHSYIVKRGFLDGRAGLRQALYRRRYYRLIAAASSTALAPVCAGSSVPSAARKS